MHNEDYLYVYISVTKTPQKQVKSSVHLINFLSVCTSLSFKYVPPADVGISDCDGVSQVLQYTPASCPTPESQCDV